MYITGENIIDIAFVILTILLFVGYFMTFDKSYTKRETEIINKIAIVVATVIIISAVVFAFFLG